VFAYKDVNGTGSVPCTAQTFGSDPTPGFAKQCFCDDIDARDTEQNEADLKYWQGLAEAKRAEEAAKAAELQRQEEIREAAEKAERLAQQKLEEEKRLAEEAEAVAKAEAAERARLKAE